MELKGYVLEKPRVGSANSPFTSSPDTVVSDSGSYNSVYGTDESDPGRTEYLTLVLSDGDLVDAEFGWTKNEGGVQRFDYTDQRFRPLPGGSRALLGALSADANTTRLVATAPTASSVVAPYRVSVGSVGSGTTFPVTTVVNDGAFSTPTAGTVQLSLDTGNLNWNPSDLTSYDGLGVYFQRQSFFSFTESTGQLGLSGDVILLNPIPGQGVGGGWQKPLLRFGFGLYLTPVSVATEANFSADPVEGTFEWARDTGRVRFNSTDLSSNPGEPVYYDGVLFEMGVSLPRQNLNTVSSPTSIVGVPSAGGDLVFRAKKGSAPTGTAVFPNTTTLQDGSANFTTSKVKVGDVVVLGSGDRRLVTSVSATQLGLAPPVSSVSTTSYLVEKKADIHQFASVSRVDTLASPGTSDTVQVDNTGGVQFSDSDQVAYGSRQVEVVFGDLPLERGLSLRLFRTPVDLGATQPSVKDVSAFVAVSGSVLADPIIGSPSVSLPVLPIDEATYPFVVEVTQGTGQFTGVLPRLDVGTPPSGFGYTLDFDSKLLNYAVRRNNQVIQITTPSAVVALPDPLVNASNPVFELNLGLGYSTLVDGEDYLLDASAGLVMLIDSLGTVQVEGSSGVVLFGSLDRLSDLSANYASLVAGDLVVVTAGSLKGIYSVVSVVSTTEIEVDPPFASAATGVQYQVRRGKEVLADRFFQEVALVDPQTKVEKIRSLGTITNSPRISIPVAEATSVRFRFASGQFSTSVVTVANDGAFTPPASLPTRVVEVSLATGNLNFSQVNVVPGGSVYKSVRLTQTVDYILSPALGLIQFTERMLAADEVLTTYASTSDPSVYLEERAAFLVRKEVTEHTIPTSTISFNPNGRSVASNPAPSVFRGGRPQSSTQVSVDTQASIIKFLPDILPTPGGAPLVSDALPHGAIVNPDERVYIDYYVYEALGGENTISVLKPPISLAQLVITDGEDSFTISGDWTAEFQVNHLLRIADNLNYITSASYNGQSTTVSVSSPFRDSFTNPRVYVSSGEIRTTVPSYFTLEPSYDTVPRGMNSVWVPGDKSGVYQSGSVLYFSSGSTKEFYLVVGAKYEASKDKTEIKIGQTTARQYGSPFVLRRSVRPIFDSTATTVRTSAPPMVIPPAQKVDESILVFRQVEGQAGVILQSPTDYRVDGSGKIDLVTPLQPLEEVSILYTRNRFVGPGQLRASYTATVVPTDSNGILNQKLNASLTSYLPDSFYFRVETMTNFQAEVSASYQASAKASSPSGGPRTDNTSTPKLYEQGAASLYYTEGHLANEDIIARAVLKSYNDPINILEDLFRNIDGRVVGDYDGKFLFDGTSGSVVSSFEDADNQIDDRFKLSDFPIDTTPPLFPLKYKGTYQSAYEASSFSRFYPTYRRKFAYTVAGADTNAKSGDAILDFEVKDIKSTTPTVDRRSPRAVLSRSASSGDVKVYVDTTNQVDVSPYRPAFANGQKVVIVSPTGSYYVPQGSPLEISGKTSTTLTFTSGVPVDIPLGATVYLADSDTAYRKSYRSGFDVSLDGDKGYLLYVKPYPPFDGSVGGVPAELEVQTPDSNELLEAGLYLSNSLRAPYRFPALDGKPLDDDGDQRIPLINPSPERELGSPGYLQTELDYISTGGVFDSDTVSPYVGVGNLSVGGSTITLTSGNFPSPVPQPGDLVRITSGLNGVTSFHRVSTVSLNSVTVDVPFSSSPDTSINFVVTSAANLASGSFTTVAGVSVTDTLANFITAGVKPGHTVIATQIGASYLERRQIVAVSATQLTLDVAFTSILAPMSYRVSNSLSTYSELGDLPAAPSALIGILDTNPDSEIATIDGFFTEILTDRLTPSTASGSVSGTTLTASGVDFVASGVQIGDFVYVEPTQANQGFYLVEEVTGPTTLTVSSAFPSAGSLTFRVVSSFTATEKSLTDLFGFRTQTVSFRNSTTSWASLVSTQVPVVVPPGTVDPNYFAMGYTAADFTARESLITARQSYLNSSLSNLEAILASGDKFYDKRYVWIDARINLEKGILVKQKRAVEDRIKTQEQTVKELTKLLALE